MEEPLLGQRRRGSRRYSNRINEYRPYNIQSRNSTCGIVSFVIGLVLFLLVLLAFFGYAQFIVDFFYNKTDLVIPASNLTHLNLEPVFQRINCFPERQGYQNLPWGISQQQCQARNCTFDADTQGVPEAPPCFMPQTIGYEVVPPPSGFEAVTGFDEVGGGGYILATLFLKPLSSIAIFDPPIQLVKFTAKLLNDAHLQIKIEDASKKRYEVPFNSPLIPSNSTNSESSSMLFSYSKRPFEFVITRKSNGAVLFNTSLGGFVFSDRFLQIATRLPSKQFYGLGENEHPSLMHDLYYKTDAMFARDQSGLGETLPLYGVHPFYMSLEDSGEASGVFLLNSNAIEFALLPLPGVIIRSIGGIFDFHIYSGDSPAKVIQQHTEFVGRPYMPPFWSLGFQLSKYGYNKLEEVEKAVNRTRSFSIPLDVIYSDIDHMDQRKDFTIDPVNFAGLPDFIRKEKPTNGLRSVIILDPAVTRNATNYDAWNVLNGNDTFVKFKNGSVMLGYVWPSGKVGFPDHFLERTRTTWIDLIQRFSKEMPFDGLWVDMNEPSNFGTNEEQPFNWPPHLAPWSLKCESSYYEDPPYRTWAIIRYDGQNFHARLSDKTLCMEGRTNDGAYRMYDTHNLYGYLESISTAKALQKTYSKRSFVLSRSTFAGSGAHVSHWLGDNVALWDHLHKSFIAVMEMSMFGIAHTGPDICGFIKTPSPQLCKRWMQAGAFYPFSRNHNADSDPPQDPGYFGPTVAEPSREYMQLRYRFLPYLYTLFYHAHTKGDTVARPTFFEYPADNNTWPLDKQMMLGSSFLVGVIVEENLSNPWMYVPQDRWLHWTKGSTRSYEFCQVPGKWLQPTDVDGPVLLQRGGSIVPSQGLNSGNVISTMFTRKQPFQLTVVPSCSKQSATGTLFWDDGESIGTIESGTYLLVSYSSVYESDKVTLKANIVNFSPNKIGNDLPYSSVVFVNIGSEPKSSHLDCFYQGQVKASCPSMKTNYDAATKLLTVDLDTEKQPMAISQSFTLTLSLV